jgi:hypothetical protein
LGWQPCGKTKNPPAGTGPLISMLNGSLLWRQIFVVPFEYDNVHKWKINLIRPYFELHIYPMKSQKEHPYLMRLSLEIVKC